MRNLKIEVPQDFWPEFKPGAQTCHQTASPTLTRLLHEEIAASYDGDLPSAVECLDGNFEACIANLCFPLGHCRAIRTTNRRGAAPDQSARRPLSSALP